MKYVVLRDRGTQYKVNEGEEFLVDFLGSDAFEPEVLLFVSDGEVTVGTPTLSKVKLTCTVLSNEEKGEKIKVFKYKSKSRYRKTIGSRPKYAKVKLEKIS